MPTTSRGTCAAAALVVMLAAATAAAQPGFGARPAEDEADMQLELVTMGIGSLPWERHGHIAICVTHGGLHQLGADLAQVQARDHTSAIETLETYLHTHRPIYGDRCYNYGVGDFGHPIQMAWGFFRGTHSFYVDSFAPAQMLWVYYKFDRTIWVQPLNGKLDHDQRQRVLDKLEDDVKPEHRAYAYDHFADNCTTRIRDILDHVTNGKLASLTTDPGDLTFRDYARDGFFGMRVPLIVTDIAMGRSTDRIPTYWERMFLPQYLREAVETGWGIVPYRLYTRTECERNEAAAAETHGAPDPSCIARGIPTVPDPKSGRILFALIIIALTSPVWLTRLWGRFQRTGLAISILPYWLLGTVLTGLAVISPLPYMLNETCLVWLTFDIVILFLKPAHKVLYAKGRVAMLGLIALLMLVNVLHQPLWSPLLWPLIPMATVAFWKPAQKAQKAPKA